MDDRLLDEAVRIGGRRTKKETVTEALVESIGRRKQTRITALADFELATEYFTACRAAGLQGSNTDFLICAAARRRGQPILTTDHDFRRFSAVVPIALHAIR